MVDMNTKDLKIISILRKDARMPLTKMSKKIMVPVSTIFDRLKLNEERFIIKHTTLLDFSKLGYHTRASITIKVDREDKEALKDFLTRHNAVNSAYRINNGYDFMIEGVFKQIQDMEEFMETMENKFKIVDKKAYFLIEDFKREAFMSDPELLLFGEKNGILTF